MAQPQRTDRLRARKLIGGGSARPAGGLQHRAPRWLRRVLVVEVVLAMIGGGLFLASDRGLAVREYASVWTDRDYRGSKAPQGQMRPDLHQLGLTPPFPRTTGRPMLLVATCGDCRSGTLVESFWRQVDIGRLSDEVELRAVVWDDRTALDLPQQFTVHRTDKPTGAAKARSALNVADSGVVLLYDGDGRWITTFHLGQLKEADLVHDVRLLKRKG